MLFSKILSACIALALASGPFAMAEKKADPWDAFAPPPDKRYDWIQLTSGEWLKGELKVMYGYSLEFDSDELDLLKLDFEDVEQIRTRGMMQVLVETDQRKSEVVYGTLIMNGEDVRLISAGQTNAYERYRVVSIADGAKRERDKWSGSVSLGINARGGNTETTDATAKANVRRRSAVTRFNLDYLANYSKVQGIESANNQRLSGYFDWFLTSRFYWQMLAGEYYRDPFSNIDNQYSISTGPGYDLIHTSKTEWTLSVGVGYQSREAISVLPGEERISDSAFGTMGTRLDYEINSKTDFLYDYSARLLNDDNGRYTHHMLTSLSFELIGDLDLDVSVIWDRIALPKANETGRVPKQDDYQLVVGVEYGF